MLGRRTTEEVEHDESNEGGEGRIDRASEGLADTFADCLFKWLGGRSVAEIFANAIKYNNGIVHRETKDDKKCGHEESIDFIAEIVAKDGEDADGDDDV